FSTCCIAEFCLTTGAIPVNRRFIEMVELQTLIEIKQGIFIVSEMVIGLPPIKIKILVKAFIMFRIGQHSRKKVDYRLIFTGFETRNAFVEGFEVLAGDPDHWQKHDDKQEVPERSDRESHNKQR